MLLSRFDPTRKPRDDLKVVKYVEHASTGLHATRNAHLTDPSAFLYVFLEISTRERQRIVQCVVCV